MQSDDTWTAMRFAGLTAYETWMHYCNMGGLTDYFEFDAYLQGLYTLGSEDADLVSQAVNELIDDVCPADEVLFCRAPYSWTRAPGDVPPTDLDGFDDAGPVRVPVDDLVGPRSADTFGSRFMSGLDVSSLMGRPCVPLPPGAPVELLAEILDSEVIGRIVSSERNQR